MAIITISRGSYTRGVEVAEALAKRLGYKLISRDALISASDKFNIPEIKLRTAIDNAPSILDRELSTHLEKSDVESCVHGRECYHLGFQLDQFVKSYQAKQDR